MELVQHILCLTRCGFRISMSLKISRPQLTASAFQFLRYTFLYELDEVFRNLDSHDTVMCSDCKVRIIRISQVVKRKVNIDGSKDYKMVLICMIVWLKTTLAGSDNSKVVHTFCLVRYCFEFSLSAYFFCLLVQPITLLKPVVMVIDEYWMKNCFGCSKRFQEIQSTEETHKEIIFYPLKWYCCNQQTKRNWGVPFKKATSNWLFLEFSLFPTTSQSSGYNIWAQAEAVQCTPSAMRQTLFCLCIHL